MQIEHKNKLLSDALDHIIKIRDKIRNAIVVKETKNSTMVKDSIRLSPGDALAARKILAINQERVENLKQLYPSPYFSYCEFVVNGEKKKMYFSKFSFNDENIYSWITPAAALRFENIGAASYIRPDGSKQTGKLIRKDQYMIVDGKLIFFSSEEVEKRRELIYQENFTRHKSGFVLPEVVEQMEKAQDQVIRAPYKDPFLISGPAGSGKTTLALHRIAYLLQSPETAEYFSADSILVIVQDVGTKEYFSHLLPDLGILGVTILTFAEWAFSILDLKGYLYFTGDEINEELKIAYEYEKLTAMRNQYNVNIKKKIFTDLSKKYNFSGTKHKELFDNQRQTKSLDRIDLTILLQAYLEENKQFNFIKEYYEETVRGSYRKRRGLFKVQYNLVVIDEFQNYLPEQIGLLKTCMNRRVNSIVYVGDLAQQTQLGTLKDWEIIGEKFDIERKVILQKVYRNTKQILKFLSDLGYKVNIPTELKSGLPVMQISVQSKEEEIDYIRMNLNKSPNATSGILCKDKKYLDEFKKNFSGEKNIFCLDFREAQGVEFDQVFIVGISKEQFSLSNIPNEIQSETKKIYRDLLYVSLTRAMSELHILGKDNLVDCINNFSD